MVNSKKLATVGHGTSSCPWSVWQGLVSLFLVPSTSDKNPADLSCGKCSVSSGLLKILVTHPWSQNLAEWRKNSSRGRLIFITHTAMVKNLCCQISIDEKIHPLVFQCGFLSSEFEDRIPGLVVVESDYERLMASSIRTQGMVHSIHKYGIVQCCTSRARIKLADELQTSICQLVQGYWWFQRSGILNRLLALLVSCIVHSSQLSDVCTDSPVKLVVIMFIYVCNFPVTAARGTCMMHTVSEIDMNLVSTFKLRWRLSASFIFRNNWTLFSGLICSFALFPYHYCALSLSSFLCHTSQWEFCWIASIAYCLTPLQKQHRCYCVNY